MSESIFQSLFQVRVMFHEKRKKSLIQLATQAVAQELFLTTTITLRYTGKLHILSHRMLKFMYQK